MQSPRNIVDQNETDRWTYPTIALWHKMMEANPRSFLAFQIVGERLGINILGSSQWPPQMDITGADLGLRGSFATRVVFPLVRDSAGDGRASYLISGDMKHSLLSQHRDPIPFTLAYSTRMVLPQGRAHTPFFCASAASNASRLFLAGEVSMQLNAELHRLRDDLGLHTNGFLQAALIPTCLSQVGGPSAHLAPLRRLLLQKVPNVLHDMQLQNVFVGGKRQAFRTAAAGWIWNERDFRKELLVFEGDLLQGWDVREDVTEEQILARASMLVYLQEMLSLLDGAAEMCGIGRPARKGVPSEPHEISPPAVRSRHSNEKLLELSNELTRAIQTRKELHQAYEARQHARRLAMPA